MGAILTAHELHPFSGMDIPSLLVQRALTRQHHPFLVWAPFEGPGAQWTYGQFLERVRRVAGGLQQRGVAAGEHVLVHLDNCPEALLKSA